MKTFDDICSIIEEIRKDAVLTRKGNKSAARRVRKGCLQIKKLAATLRKECIDIVHNGPPASEIAE